MKFLTPILVLFFLFQGCKKENDVTSVPEETVERNQWVVNVLRADYLWENTLPSGLRPSIEPDTEAYFYRLLYKDDRWSYITDDFNGLLDALFGVYKDFGFTYVLTYMYPPERGKNDVVGIVQYVMPDSPASRAGLKRGDVFYRVNGEALNTTNYNTLLDADFYTLKFVGKDAQNEVVELDKTIEMAAVVLEEDPIHHYSVIETNGKKVGYLMYNAFIYTETDSAKLVHVMQSFKEANVSDVVLDLRYNGGGATYMATLLASMLVGKQHMQNEDVFYSYIYNEAYQNYFKRYEGDDSPNLRVRFMPVPVNLDLSTLYVLTLGGTASSSELVMNGLDPYLNVVQIGDTTYGKYTVSVPIPHDETAEDTWGMLPIIAKSVNTKGVTDYNGGFAPDVYAMDDLMHPLGDPNEELLNIALSYIDGTRFPAPKSATLPKENVLKRKGGNAVLLKGIMTK